jgi:tRNA A-37 threonylcarbamoyl transferase component Bud32
MGSSFIRENMLAPMHAAGWHHHDVAERNVVIDKFGTLRLVDFQLATQDCRYGGECPDVEFVEIYDLPPLPSACTSSNT